MTANPEVTAPPEGTARLVSLSDALAAGLVSMTATGKNLEELSVDVTSLSDEVLAVDVPAGLVFKPLAGSTQPMIVIRAALIDLAPGGSESRRLSVACASMDLDQPDDSDSFAISTAKSPAAMLKLLALPHFRDADFRVQQFAIWTITDDPTRSGYVGLGSFSFGSGPDDEEITQIRSLFKEAGIDPANYRALR